MELRPYLQFKDFALDEYESLVARARWKLGTADLEQVKATKHAAIAALRTELGWPRWIALVEADNELPVDLDNARVFLEDYAI